MANVISDGNNGICAESLQSYWNCLTRKKKRERHGEYAGLY